jgi:hypothetical protein
MYKTKRNRASAYTIPPQSKNLSPLFSWVTIVGVIGGSLWLANIYHPWAYSEICNDSDCKPRYTLTSAFNDSSSNQVNTATFNNKAQKITKNVGLYISTKFLEALGKRESGGEYKTRNKSGYLGKYQMGEPALIDLGYARRDGNNDDNKITWTGKDNIWSNEDFKNNKTVQDKAVRYYHNIIWARIENRDDYLGKTINGIKITQSGMLAAAHLVGPGGLNTFLKSNGKRIPKDGNGTAVTEYLKAFQKYGI